MRKRRQPRAIIAVVSGAMLLIVAASCSLRQADRTTTPAAGQVAKTPTTPEKKTIAEPAVSFMANSFCKACHLDFDEERLVLNHKAAGIGCERCHGESLRHRSDEANVTPPDLMYPKERINPTCMMCHPRQAIQQVESHRPILEANLSALETAPAGGHSPKYCTDCHGHGNEHRMKVRTIQWDKCTGQLIKRVGAAESPNPAGRRAR